MFSKILKSEEVRRRHFKWNLENTYTTSVTQRLLDVLYKMGVTPFQDMLINPEASICKFEWK